MQRFLSVAIFIAAFCGDISVANGEPMYVPADKSITIAEPLALDDGMVLDGTATIIPPGIVTNINKTAAISGSGVLYSFQSNQWVSASAWTGEYHICWTNSYTRIGVKNYISENSILCFDAPFTNGYFRSYITKTEAEAEANQLISNVVFNADITFTRGFYTTEKFDSHYTLQIQNLSGAGNWTFDYMPPYKEEYIISYAVTNLTDYTGTITLTNQNCFSLGKVSLSAAPQSDCIVHVNLRGGELYNAAREDMSQGTATVPLYLKGKLVDTANLVFATKDGVSGLYVQGTIPASDQISDEEFTAAVTPESLKPIAMSTIVNNKAVITCESTPGVWYGLLYGGTLSPSEATSLTKATDTTIELECPITSNPTFIKIRATNSGE